MKLYDKADVRLEEIGRPQIAIGELLLKTEAVFLCGTEGVPKNWTVLIGGL